MLCHDDIDDAQTYRIIVSVLTKNQTDTVKSVACLIHTK